LTAEKWDQVHKVAIAWSILQRSAEYRNDIQGVRTVVTNTVPMPPDLNVSFCIPSNETQTLKLCSFSNEKPKIFGEGSLARTPWLLSFEGKNQILEHAK